MYEPYVLVERDVGVIYLSVVNPKSRASIVLNVYPTDNPEIIDYTRKRAINLAELLGIDFKEKRLKEL